MSDVTTEPRQGRFGPPVGWFKHEVANWVRSRLREATGAPAMDPIPEPEVPEIIREKECERLTGLGRVHRWKLEQRGQFPRRVRLHNARATADGIR
jgi:predicted DNA-binding transcriptional regulator AlpA